MGVSRLMAGDFAIIPSQLGGVRACLELGTFVECGRLTH